MTDVDGNVVTAIPGLDILGTSPSGSCDHSDPSLSYSDFGTWAEPFAFDSALNMYIPDEFYSKVVIYKTPYSPNGTCLQNPLGSIIRSSSFNSITPKGWNGATAFFVYGNQLGIVDGHRTLVMNDWKNTPNGSDSDFVIGEPNPYTIDPYYERGEHPTTEFIVGSVDELGRLWSFWNGPNLAVFQLPLTHSSHPIQKNLSLYWADDPITAISMNVGTIAFHEGVMWVADYNHHRILRVRNYQDLSAKLLVDQVLGQVTKSGTNCNRVDADPSTWGQHPQANTLCLPANLSFDRLGNMYIVENNYEGHGNQRMVVLMKQDLDGAHGMFPDLSARKVFNAPDFTTQGPNDGGSLNMPNTPISAAFDSQNHMIIGADGYYGSDDFRPVRAYRQLWYYADPLKKGGDGNYILNQKPDGYLNLPLGAAGDMLIDSDDNLLILDHTWSRFWGINYFRDPSWLILNPAPDVPLSN